MSAFPSGSKLCKYSVFLFPNLTFRCNTPGFKVGKTHDALRVALKLNRRELVESTFAGCSDPLMKKQLCYLLARHGFSLQLDEGPAEVWEGGLRSRGLQGGDIAVQKC